jgi:hypothetical protein
MRPSRCPHVNPLAADLQVFSSPTVRQDKSHCVDQARCRKAGQTGNDPKGKALKQNYW